MKDSSKLLHERLREWADKFDVAIESTGEAVCLSIDDRKAYELASEIERCYIPRPRFDDGEPVKEGDEVDGELVRMIEVSNDGSWRLYNGSGCQIHNGEAYQLINRPVPEVLDADGVPINVGDTVYRKTDGLRLNVASVHNDDDCGGCFADKDGCSFVAKYFTHEQPVFDADGVVIHKGDTVWEIDSGAECVVTKIDASKLLEVCVRIDGGNMQYGHGYNFSHEKPDSLEEIERDMRNMYKDWATDPKKWLEMADRIYRIKDSCRC